MARNIWKKLENAIKNGKLINDINKKRKILENIEKLKEQKINLMITGATGVGKSSTINALFNMEVAKVGVGVDPETMDIKKYELDNLIIWDTPGLGDGVQKDIQYANAIKRKLHELDENGEPLIDLVLVILDAGSKDLGTSYKLINEVIIPNLGKNAQDRILIALNQADTAMKGKYWDESRNKPEPTLIKFLNEKVESIKKRIKESTGIDVESIYYSAGDKEDGKEQRSWNLSKLLYLIVKHTPTKKRLSYLNNISNDKESWKDDDGKKNYKMETEKSLAETVIEYGIKGAALGKELGKFFPKIGEDVGKVIGGVVGGVYGFFKGLFE